MRANADRGRTGLASPALSVSPPRRRFAFTLIELLVSIAIIGVLAALLMPAVQGARENARRTMCRNNLKEMALAFQVHHEHLGFFPSGGFDFFYPPTWIGGAPAVGAQQGAGWGFQVLPYLEAQPSWRGGSGQTEEDRQIVAIGTTNSVFFCPTRRGPQSLTYSDPLYMGGLTITHALCDYAGSNFEGTGVVRRYFPTRIAEVTDGTACTLLLGEKRLNDQFLGQWQGDDNEGYTCGWDEDTMRNTTQPPAPDYFAPSGEGGRVFGSAHPSGFQVAFVDGSVHTISYVVDATLFQNLGTMNDGQVIPADF